MRSLRDHCLEAQQQYLAAHRITTQPGRPDRAAILAHSGAVEEAEKAEERFHQALDELHTLDIYCLDPAAGLALIPFARDNRLAWFVFELFDEIDSIRSWRFHQDPLEQRRPIAEALTEPPGNESVV